MSRGGRRFLNSRYNTRVELETVVAPESRPVKPQTRPEVPRICSHPRSTSRFIPRLGGALKLLIDPRREIGLNPVAASEALGSNVLVNGGFHDFTMENDANTVGHWIFDSVFNVENGGGGYIGEDWSQGGANYGTELVSNGDFSADSNNDGLADSWSVAGSQPVVTEIINGAQRVKAGGNVIQSMVITQTVSGNASAIYCLRFDLIEWTYPVQVAVRDSVDGTYFVNWVSIPSAGSWELVFSTPATISGGLKILFGNYGNVFDPGDYFSIDNVTLKQLTNGNHLIHGGWSFANQVDSQLTGSNPAYENGNALQFDGINDYFYVPAAQATAFNPGTGDFTVECWIVIGNVDGYRHTIIAKGANSGPTAVSWAIWVAETGAIRVYVSDGTTTWVDFTTTQTYSQGQKLYIAFVADRDGAQKLFVNGVLTNSQSVTNTTDLTNTENLVIGYPKGGEQKYFNGEIAEIRYSNVARTDDEIKQSYGLANGWKYWNTAGTTPENSNFSQKSISDGTNNNLIYKNFNVEQNKLYRLDLVAETSNGFYADFDIGVFTYGWATIFNREKVKTKDAPERITMYFNSGANNTLRIRLGFSEFVSCFFKVDSIQIRPVVSAKQPPNFVEDFTYAGAKYVKITSANQQIQSTSQLYTNSTKTTYYWGDGVSLEAVGDFRVIGGNHGLLNGSMESTQPKHPAAFECDGIDDYGDLKEQILLGGNDFLLFFWVKTSATTSGNGLIVWRRNDANNYAAVFWLPYGGSGGVQRFGFSNDGSTAVNFYSDTPVNNGKWHFVCVVGDQANGEIRFYIDGKPDGSSTGLTTFTREKSLIVFASEWAGSIASFYEGEAGVGGVYVFDTWPLSRLIGSEEKLISFIYGQTKIFYGD